MRQKSKFKVMQYLNFSKFIKEIEKKIKVKKERLYERISLEVLKVL